MVEVMTVREDEARLAAHEEAEEEAEVEAEAAVDEPAPVAGYPAADAMDEEDEVEAGAEEEGVEEEEAENIEFAGEGEEVGVMMEGVEEVDEEEEEVGEDEEEAQEEVEEEEGEEAEEEVDFVDDVVGDPAAVEDIEEEAHKVRTERPWALVTPSIGAHQP